MWSFKSEASVSPSPLGLLKPSRTFGVQSQLLWALILPVPELLAGTPPSWLLSSTEPVLGCSVFMPLFPDITQTGCSPLTLFFNGFPKLCFILFTCYRVKSVPYS